MNDVTQRREKHPKEITDRRLIAGCIRGDREMRETFVLRFSNLVYMAVQGVFRTRRETPVSLDVNDLHNSVFVSLFDRNCRKLSQYEGRNGCSLASFIRMIAVRHTLDHFRKDKGGMALDADVESLEFLPELRPDTPSALDALEEAERLRLVNEAMEDLLPRDRLVIRLTCFDERPLEEVGKMMNLSPTALYSLKSRAIQRLKRLIEARA